MNFGQRIIGVFASALVLTLSLGACTFFTESSDVANVGGVNSLEQRALIDATNAVTVIDGVASVATAATPDDVWNSDIEFEVVVNVGISDASMRAVAATVRNRFDRPELANVSAFLTVRTPATVNGAFELREFAIPEEAVASNFAYWQAAQTAIKTELRMELWPSPQGDDLYMRSLSAAEGAVAVNTMNHFVENFDALAAVRDGNVDESYTFWSLAGFQSARTLPPAAVIELLEDTRTIVPLVDGSPGELVSEADLRLLEGLTVSWTAADGVLPATAITINQTRNRDADWRAAIDVATRASSEPDLSFEYIAGRHQFRLLTSQCDGRVDTTSDDQKFFDALVATGVPLSPTVAPGVCSPEF